MTIGLGDVLSIERVEAEELDDEILAVGDLKWFWAPVEHGRRLPFLTEVVAISTELAVDVLVVAFGEPYTVH